MSGPDAFFDTNVLLYLLADDEAKANRAEAILAEGGVVSVQVLNEFAAVARRKLGMSWPEIREILTTVRAICAVEPLTEATHELGVSIAERFGYTIYDGLIIASASLAGCGVLYSEDMQDGQIVESVTICNPF